MQIPGPVVISATGGAPLKTNTPTTHSLPETDLGQHLAAIIESSDDAILSKNLHGIILSWNRAAEKIFGYTAAEIVGRPVTLLIPAGHLNEEPDILARLRRGEKIDHYETIRQRKDGTLINISLTVSPIMDATGNVVGASKIARDITRQKIAEQAVRTAQQDLARLNEELEQRVLQRTESLNKALTQMEEFSYSVSHDLRNPVRAMQAYAKALLEDYGGRLDEAGNDYVQKIIRSSTRMDKLILDVLIYSRIARDQIATAPISLDLFVPEIIQQYPEMQPPKAEINITPPLGSVLAHEPSLAQALSNVLNNAVKFVSSGIVPRINIQSRRQGGFVRLRITDNGIGIPPEFKDRAFKMFERASQDAGYEGTGIGLAIVRKAIEKMGGSVGFESDGKNGTSVWLDLPAAT